MALDDRQVLLDRIASLEAQLNEKENAEKQRTLAMSLLNAALEATADGILIIDSAGKVASCNRRFVDLWRIPDELLASRDDQRLLGYVVDQLVNPQDFIAKVESLYTQPLAESFDVLTFTDGRTFERYSRPQVLAGASVGRVWSFRDVTARVAAEQDAIRTRTSELLLEAQAATLAQLSTPLIPISDQVMVMPLIGAIDDRRARLITETLLSGMARTRARICIVDITGVTDVDTHVASALVRSARYVKLLGAEVILTGIRPAAAEALVDLDINLRGLLIRGTLQAGIGYALDRKQKDQE